MEFALLILQPPILMKTIPGGGRSFLFWPDKFATEQDMVNEPIPGIEIVGHERE